MFERIGFSEILVIGILFFLFFGAKRLPEMGASVGKGIREFKRSLSEISEDLPPSQSNQQAPAPRQLDQPASPPSGGAPKRLSQ
ncbi:MAG: twin-arginine translocase TatA/TatE family subunit [Gemmatimonadales bacterium]|jgi:sec-independent protein translocase protein TatA